MSEARLVVVSSVDLLVLGLIVSSLILKPLTMIIPTTTTTINTSRMVKLGFIYLK